MKARKEEKGLTWLKRDLGVDLVSNKPNTVTAPVDLTQQELTFSPHMFPGVVAEVHVDLLRALDLPVAVLRLTV